MSNWLQVTNSDACTLLELDLGDTTAGWNDDPDYPFTYNFKLVHAEMIDTSRWSIINERVYEDLDTGRFWYTTYSYGATECQDERPYEYDGDVITFTEVFKKEKTITVYE